MMWILGIIGCVMIAIIVDGANKKDEVQMLSHNKSAKNGNWKLFVSCDKNACMHRIAVFESGLVNVYNGKNQIIFEDMACNIRGLEISNNNQMITKLQLLGGLVSTKKKDLSLVIKTDNFNMPVVVIGFNENETELVNLLNTIEIVAKKEKV
ncbi:MAG: hypothetical protein ACRC51_11090 [Cetobacterium sp.]